MTDGRHIYLLDQYRDGRPCQEPVHADEVRPGVFRVLYSPGFVQGVAAGDEVRITGADGAFEVVRRGGNLALQVFTLEPIGPLVPDLEAAVRRLGGVLDGGIERGAVFTIPAAAGFPAVERLFTDWAAAHPGAEWYYGNVYGPDGEPLGWWDG